MKKLLFLFFACVSLTAFAGKRYWIATGAGAYSWNSTSYWSTSSGGASGASVPGSSDTAYFDANGLGRCDIDATVNVKRFDMTSGFTDTVSQGNYTITVGSGKMVLAGGVFLGGSYAITVNGAYSLEGAYFQSTSGTLTINSTSYSFTSGTFAHNNGHVKFTGSGAIVITGSTTFDSLQFAVSANGTTINIASGITLSATDFVVSGTYQTTLTGTGSIQVSGDIYISNTYATQSSAPTITINGSGSQHLYGFASGSGFHLPKVTINKSSDTLHLHNNIPCSGDWTYTAGVIDAGTSLVQFNNILTISGTFTLYHVAFVGGALNYTYTLTSATLTVAGTLYMTHQNGSGYLKMTGGTINAQGNITIANSTNNNTVSGGTTTIVVNGSGNQTMTGVSGAGYSRMPSITINKSSGTLTLIDYITVMGNWTYTAGTIDPGTSTVVFSTSKTISGSHTLYNVQFGGGATFTVASGTTLTVSGTLFYAGTTASTFNTGDIYLSGDCDVSNTGSSTNGGSAIFTFTGTSSQTFTGSGTNGAGTLPNIVIDKTGGTLSLASTISCSGDWTYTQGTVSPGTSSVVFIGSKNLDGQGSSGTMPFYRIATFSSGTRTLTGNLDINDKLLISASTTLSAGSYTMNVGGQWSNNGTWTAGTGTVVFDGSGYSQLSKSGGAVETFNNLTMNRSATASSYKLTSPVKVNGTLTMTKGILKTTRVTAYLELADNALVSGGSDSAYVHGAVLKTGNDTVWFPLGDTTLTTGAFHPLRISAPSVTTDKFEAEYLAKNPTDAGFPADSLGDTLTSVSTCNYWKLQRKSGSSTVTARISSNENASCVAEDFAAMRVAAFDTATGKWRDLGASNRQVFGNLAFVSSASAITLPMTLNPMAITTAKKQPSLVYAVLRRKLDGGFFLVTNAQLYFRYDEEYNDTDGKLTFNIYKNDDNSLISSNTIIAPQSLVPSIAYGDNRCHLNLMGCNVLDGGGYLQDGYYILEVINEKNEKRYLRFKNTNSFVISCGGSWGQ